MANKFPVIAAHMKRVIHRGPLFKREGKLWRIEDHTGVIYVPFIRRYGMYTQTISRRINSMLARYPTGELTESLVLDVGAHVGEFAIAAAPYAKKIICFEPDPIVCAALIENTKNFKNVKVLPFALSDQTKTTEFFVATAHADSSFVEPEKYDSIIQVDARRLDSLNIEITGYSRVILKMDAEGFEPEVLIGGGSWLSKLDTVAIDVAPERMGADTYKEVKAILEKQGFSEVKLTEAQVLVMQKRKL